MNGELSVGKIVILAMVSIYRLFQGIILLLNGFCQQWLTKQNYSIFIQTG